MDDSTVRLYFEVQDSGIGISPENQLKLFKSFAQAEVSTSRRFGGTGLGLAIAKNLVELMNGSIGITSEEGKGAVFHFNCEFEPSGQSHFTVENKESNERKVQIKKLKILLAEDNIINQKVAILNLQKLGHEVITVSDGIQAVEKFISIQPDAIFMDIQMPEMDGVEATGKIREWEKANSIENYVPIIAMTANTMKSDIELFMAAGMNEYLSKPFSTADLVLVIEWIQRHIEEKTNK